MVKMEEKVKPKTVQVPYSALALVLAVIAIGILAFNQYQIFTITGAMGEVSIANPTQTTQTQTTTPTTQTSTSDEAVQQALEATMPTGVPETYGDELDISFDEPTTGLNALANLEREISFSDLSETQQARYVEIATTPHTACEYCCGIGSKGFGTAEGKVACGCAHNLAFSGLTKYLLQNHESEYSNEQIIDEIHNWKALFFPKQTVQKYLEETGQLSAAGSLPGMVGGC